MSKSKSELQKEYNAAKSAYKKAGTELFKAGHGGKTAKEVSKKRKRK